MGNCHELCNGEGGFRERTRWTSENFHSSPFQRNLPDCGLKQFCFSLPAIEGPNVLPTINKSNKTRRSIGQAFFDEIKQLCSSEKAPFQNPADDQRTNSQPWGPSTAKTAFTAPWFR